jgi:hypothetical protein
MELVNYTLKKVFPGIFVVVVKDPYERAMLFLRCQEFYESPFPEFKGKHFDLFHYMDYYRKKGIVNYFSYPKDWAGFNIPGEIIEECINHVLGDNSSVFPSPYDYVMKKITDEIKGQLGEEKKWYLIGVDEEDGRIMEHEISHGLFYLNPDYREKSTKLVSDLPYDIFSELKDIIVSMGYCEEVIPDEIQAYLSTGLTPIMSHIPGISDYRDLFESNFKGFY